MEFQDLVNVGGDILKDVTDAIDNNNYAGLSSRIAGRIGDFGAAVTREAAEQEAKAAAERAARQEELFRKFRERTQSGEGGYHSSSGYYRSANSGRYSAGDYNRTAEWKAKQAEERERARQRQARERSGNPDGRAGTQPETYFLQTRPSRNTGLGKIVTGAAGTLVSGTMAAGSFASLILHAALGTGIAGAAGLAAFSAMFLGGSIALIVSGRGDMNLVRRYYEYARALGKKEYFSVKEMAAQFSRKEKNLLDDLRKMMRKGYLPRAHIDAANTTMMLTDSAWEQYSQAEASRRERELKEYASGGKDPTLNKASKTAKAGWGGSEVDVTDADPRDMMELTGNPEVDKILTDGRSYLRMVREANDAIPGAEMTAKLSRLEEIIRRIFDEVKREPKRASDLQKFMNYYLPTTSKLLSAYVELDSKPSIGSNIPETKREIEEALDTINDAFERYFDDLFQDVAWDISSDISVMKTMMAQDGLTGRDTEKNKDH